MFGFKKHDGCKLGVLATLTFAGLASQAFASADTLVLTPPLGWNSWNVFHENINEKQIQLAGKRIGFVEIIENDEPSMSKTLRNAGFGKGVYILRSKTRAFMVPVDR